MALSAASAVIFAYGTSESMKESQRARNSTNEAKNQSARQFAAESKKADIQNVRTVRSQIRASQLARGTMTNVGAQTGGTGGSAMAGGIASIGSQLGSNLSYMSDIAKVNTTIGQAALGYSSAMADASIASSKAQDFSNIASIGSTIFSGSGGYEKVNKYLS